SSPRFCAWAGETQQARNSAAIIHRERIIVLLPQALFDAQELHLEYEGGLRRDWAAGRTGIAISELRRDGEFALAAYFHGQDAFVPSFDDLALADGELEGRATVLAAVELGAVRQPAGVVHGNRLAGLWAGPLTHHEVFVLQPRLGSNRL